MDNLVDFEAELSNEDGERLIVGFDKAKNEYFIDRSKAGETNFSNKFITVTVAPLTVKAQRSDVRFYWIEIQLNCS